MGLHDVSPFLSVTEYGAFVWGVSGCGVGGLMEKRGGVYLMT